MTVDLAGRAALVTGGNRGLGKAMAEALARAGANVILVARDAAKLEEAAGAIRAAGGAASVYPADVADEAQVEALRDAVLRDHGRLDILINNAGINLRKPLVEFTLEEWRRVIDTNLTSVFLMCRAFVPLMRGRGYGRIINIGSTMSRVSIAGRAAYSSSKAAILGLTRALALEVAPEGITVNAMCPGPFATELNTALLADPERAAWFLSRTPVGRWGNVEEVGEMAVYLCSEKSGFVTGADLAIDGGWLAQ
jgi:NAD(P)-dependent dehydrogenase (short-subunit alcohol dehydrogenase family)